MSDPSPMPITPRLLTQFEGRPLTILTVGDRPAWIAREVGTAIGYASGGKRLVSLVTDEWSDEFIAGHDYVFVQGDDLASLKSASPAAAVAAKAPVILLLFEPGLHLVLTKTSKPVGRRLRRFLVDEVLPKLVRGEEPKPTPTVSVGLTLHGGEALRWVREIRLAHRVDLDDRSYRAGALHQCVRLLHGAGRLDDDEAAEWEVRIAELALGHALEELRQIGSDLTPPPPDAGGIAADVISELLGVSPSRIRRAALQLGLTLPGDDDPFDDGLVAQIKALLVQQGFIRPRAA